MSDTRAPALQRADFIRKNWALITPWQFAPYLREATQQAILKEHAPKREADGDTSQKA